MEAIIILLGLLLGSFLNVCIYRIPKGESISYPPSHCSACGSNLKPYDLIPVLSYIFLRGKCRACGERISARYPVVELLNSVLYLTVFLSVDELGTALFYMALVSILLVISFIDYDHKIIPDGLNLAIVLLYIGYLLYNITVKGQLELVDPALGFLVGGGFYLLVALLTAGAMGGGDIKFMAVLGLFLGLGGTVLALFLTFLIGGVFSLGLIVFKGAGRKQEVPFGPFIALGSSLSLLYASEIIDVYFNLII